MKIKRVENRKDLPKRIMAIAVFILLAMFLFAHTACSDKDDTFEIYTVTFNTDGGSPIPATQHVEAGNTAAAPATNPTKAGYVFVFWYLNSSATAYNFQTPVRDHITLRAKWQEETTVEYWQVTWNLNGGTWPSGDNHAIQVVKGGTLAEPAAPVKTGSTFDGWYTEAALTNQASFPYDVNSVTDNFTLYAKWTDGGTEPSGYQLFTSISALKSWLSAQPDNTAETAYKVGLKDINLDNGNNWNDLGVAVSGSKYVDLNLSGCTGTVIPDGYSEWQSNNKIVYYGVFAGCYKLKAVTLPKSLKTIGKYAFFKCYGLQSVVFPEGLIHINSSSFMSCGLYSITLPKGLKTIGGYVFRENKFTSVTIPGTVTDLDTWSFYYCQDLETVVLEKGVESIGESTFGLCSSLKFVTLPEGLKTIGLGAFSDGKYLETITIPSSVTEIQDKAFDGIDFLSDVIMLSATPPSLGRNVFRDTSASLKIKVPAAGINAYKTAYGWKDYAARIVADTD